MKKVIGLILLVVSMFIFSGCGKAINYPVVHKVENSNIVEIKVEEEFAPKIQHKISMDNLSEISLYDAIKKAAEYSLSEGYSNFAILNGGINNLNGFPVTNYGDLRDYCFSYKFNQSFYGSESYEKCEGISKKGRTIVKLKIIPLKESSEIFSWNAKEVLDELK